MRIPETRSPRSAAGKARPERLLILAAIGALAALARSGQRPSRARPRSEPTSDSQPAGDGRGRASTRPAEIPPKGWRDIALRTYKEFTRDRVLALAAGVTFYSLLALFPAMAAFVSLYGLFFDAGAVAAQLSAASGLLPGGAIEILGGELQRLASQSSTALGLGFVLGLAIALWSANAGVKALFDALNVVYNEEEKRGFLRLNAVSLAFTLGGIVLLALAVTSVVAVPIALEFLGLSKVAEWLISLLRWPALAIIVALALALIYRYGPSRETPRWQWVTWGSALAAVTWLILSALFSWYVANFGSYNKTYGSLGAVIGFMTWMWLSTTVLLAGAELNAEMEHQTEADSTVGAPRPLGARGAEMADTVGPPQD